MWDRSRGAVLMSVSLVEHSRRFVRVGWLWLRRLAHPHIVQPSHHFVRAGSLSLRGAHASFLPRILYSPLRKDLVER